MKSLIASLAVVVIPMAANADSLKFSQDRAAILSMAGAFEVEFNFKETAALAEGYDVMVGCMVGSSLAMAPATLVAQGALVTDLDGPLLLAEDRDTPLIFDDAGVHPPVSALWG